MILTIDGPAGTGKSTVAQRVAERLGFDFLDTGAMYRAVGLAIVRVKADLEDAERLAAVAAMCVIRFDWSRRPPALLLNDQAVEGLIRSSDVTRAASFAAAVPAVRQSLVRQQQQIGREHTRLVTEGRDQGSVVFPDARLKIYLTASAQERARRRVAQLRSRGDAADFDAVLQEINERDQRDASRTVGPLSIPTGALVIDTTELTQDQVIDRIVAEAETRALR